MLVKQLKILIGFFALLFSACGYAGMGGGIVSPPPCASGFTRIGTNFCKANNLDTYILTSAAFPGSTCSLSPPIDSGDWGVLGVGPDITTPVKALLLNVSIVINSSGVAGQWHLFHVKAFLPTDSTCTTETQHWAQSAYEYVAVTANTEISLGGRNEIVLTNSKGQFYWDTGTTDTASGVSGVYLQGYYQ